MSNTDTTVDVAVRGSQSAQATILASIANQDELFMTDLEATIKAGDIVKTSPVKVLADLQRIAARNPERFDLDAFPRVNSVQSDGLNNWDKFNDGIDDTSLCDAFAMSLTPGLKLTATKDMLEKYLAQDCVAHVGVLPTGDEWPEVLDKYATESLIGTINGRITAHKAQIRQGLQLNQTLTKFMDKLPNIRVRLPSNGKDIDDPSFAYTTSTLPIEVSDPNKNGAFKAVAAKAFLRWGAIQRDDNDKIVPDVIDKTVAAGGQYIDLVKMLQREKPEVAPPAVASDKAAAQLNLKTPDQTLSAGNAILTQYYEANHKLDEKSFNNLVTMLRKPSEREGRTTISDVRDFCDAVMAKLEAEFDADKKAATETRRQANRTAAA